MAYNQKIENLVKNVLTRKRIASSSNLTYVMQVRSDDVLLFWLNFISYMMNGHGLSFVLMHMPDT